MVVKESILKSQIKMSVATNLQTADVNRSAIVNFIWRKQPITIFLFTLLLALVHWLIASFGAKIK